jgi:hypothetical protein
MVSRPVIIIKNKKEKTCIMIDVAIPADKNVSRKEAGKKVKMQEFMLQRIWNMKNMIIPEITGDTGKVNGIKKSLEAIPGKYLIDLLTKTAILRTSHTIRKVLV